MKITTTTIKGLQNNTEQLINHVLTNDEVVYVESDKGTAVIITLDEWNTFRELLVHSIKG